MPVEIVGRGQKHRIERDPTWEPGRYRAVITVHDQHYLDELNQWQEVNESLEPDGTDGYIARCNKARHTLRIGSDGSRLWTPRRRYPTENVSVGRPQYYDGSRWRNLPIGTVSMIGNSLIGDATNYKLVLTFTWRAVKLSIVLKNASAPVRYRWAISPNGLALDGISRRLYSGSQYVGSILEATAIDANGVELPVANSYDGQYIEFVVNTTGAAYPVTIDPTFTDGPSGDVNTACDTWLNHDSPNSNYGTSTYLYLRNPKDSNTWARQMSLLKFTLTALEGVETTSRTLYLYLYEAWWWNAGDGPRTNRILSANQYWTEGGATWNYQDGSNRWAGDASGDGGADAGCSEPGTDFYSTPLGVYSFPGPSGNRPIGYEIAMSLGQTEFETMVENNYGLTLWHTAYAGRVCSSDHGTTDYRPKLVVEYTSGTTHDASASLSGVGTLSASAQRLLSGSAALSGVGALSVAAQRVVSGAASLAGTGSLAAIAQRVVSASASLTGLGSLAAVAQRVVSGSATLSGAGTLTALARCIVSGSASLSATGAMTAVARCIRGASASFVGSGTMAAVATLSGEILAAASFVASGTLTAVASVVRSGVAVFSGVGTFGATAQRVVSGAATMSGTGTLTAMGQRVLQGAASLSGAGTLSAVARAILGARASMVGTATMSGIGRLIVVGRATMTGIGTLTAMAMHVPLRLKARAVLSDHSRVQATVSDSLATVATVGDSSRVQAVVSDE